jgi:hypothetical protein
MTRYIRRMRFEQVWVDQCRATKAIKRRFGAKSALDYVIGEKLISFAEAARDHPAFARELPKFLAAIWHTFNEYEIAGYVATQNRHPGTVSDSFNSCASPGDVVARRRAEIVCWCAVFSWGAGALGWLASAPMQ